MPGSVVKNLRISMHECLQSIDKELKEGERFLYERMRNQGLTI